MSNVYIIKNTAGTEAITLKPGSLNGFGGSQHDTDMRLYGMGALLWGEGIDENVYRLTENFACPAKELNDYNPATGILDYNPATDPIMPKDSRDPGIGTGNGINKPIAGQTWFNTTSDNLYVYDGSAWKVPGVSGADYVLKAGDTMTGNLRIEKTDKPVLTLTTTQFSTGGPEIVMYNKDNDSFVGGGTGTFGWTGISNPDGMIFQIDAAALENEIGVAASSPRFWITQDGLLEVGTAAYESLVTTDDSIPNKKYVDTAVASAVGGVGTIITDHGALTGLADDDHPQYLNNTRGDTRYYTKAEVDAAVGVATAAAPLYENQSKAGGAAVINTGVTTTAAAGGKVFLQVFVNGILQIETLGFNVTGATQITLTSPPSTTYDVAIFAFG